MNTVHVMCRASPDEQLRVTALVHGLQVQLIHHQVDDRGHHLPHDPGTLGYLAAIDDSNSIV